VNKILQVSLLALGALSLLFSIAFMFTSFSKDFALPYLGLALLLDGIAMLCAFIVMKTTEQEAWEK